MAYLNPTPYLNAYSNPNSPINASYVASGAGLQPNPYNYAQGQNYAPVPPVINAQAQSQQVQAPQQTSTDNPFILIPNREAIKDVFVAPGKSVWAMSQNASEFYFKSADNMGLASTRYFKFGEFDPAMEAAQMQAQAQQPIAPNADFVPRSEFNQFVANVSAELQSVRQSLLNEPQNIIAEEPKPTLVPKTSNKKTKETPND